MISAFDRTGLPDIVLVLALLLSGAGQGGPAAHADEVPYRHFTAFDGLPNESITALAQTSNGLLWIGTIGGLAVYDGAEFRTIPFPDSVAPSQILSIQPRPDGSVWAGTHLGTILEVHPSGVKRVIRLGKSATLSRILTRGDTLLFVTTRAVWTLPPGEKQPTRQSLRYELRTPTAATGAPDHVGVGPWDAAVGPKGNLWILDGRRGPGRFHSDGSVTFLDSPVAEKGRYWNVLRFTKEGTAVATQGEHLYRFSPSATNVNLDLDDLDGAPVALQNGIAYLSQGHRLLRYDVVTGQVLGTPGPELGLPEVSPITVLPTRDDGLWVGTHGGLLHLMAPGTRHVQTIGGQSLQYVTHVFDKGERLWASSWGSGLLQLRPRRRRAMPGGKNKWNYLPAQNGFLHVLAAPGKDWHRWSAQTGWERLKEDMEAVRGFVDDRGTGFFWQDDGLYRTSPLADGQPTRLASWPSSERGHYMMALAPNGDPILRARRHVLRLRPSDGTVKDTLASFPDGAPVSGRRGIGMRVDSEGRVWGALYEGGLLHVDPNEDEHGLLLKERSVESVKTVADSLVLASTHGGVYLIDAHSGAVRRHLTQADGLLSNTTSGAYLTADTLYVTHPSGLTLLPADRVFQGHSSPPSLLTEMEVNLEDRALANDSVLAASERAVGFSYTAPELTHPERVRYEVRLTPRDTGWRSTERDFTRYTDLDPGTYQFEVRARLGDAPPGPKATYAFTIPPFFYETWWFQLLVGLGLIGLGIGAWRWRTSRLRRRQEKLEAAVETRTEELAAEKQKTEKQAERLAELDEAKNRFFAHISHEFRTPLSLVLTPLEEALRDATAGTIAFGTEQVERMVRNARRLQRLIEQLLDLATLEAGRMELDRQLGNLTQVVRRVAGAFSSMADRNGIDLQIRTTGEPLQARFDAEKVESIVSNLVSNALKFTPEGGRVTIWIGERKTPRSEAGQDREALLKVADTGPGMDAETQDRIFERFEHADATDTREHEGAGLGLALTKELVDLHGGTIEVESSSGEGTTFTVALPIVSAEEAASGDRVWARRSEDVGGDGARGEEWRGEGRGDEEAGEEMATVLVVEDNAEMRAYLRKQLSPHWQVQAAADGAEGWDAVQEHAPDLVLSDVMMPEVDGFELCEKIKDDPALRDTPVLLLTARAETEGAIEGLGCGADDYVSKPFDATELRQRIENHLAAREHLRDQYQQEVRLESMEMVVEEQHLSFLETVTETVEAHLGDPDFSVDRLAEAVALSRRQLTRRMKEAIGQTPAAFIRARRIDQAKQLLAGEAETVAEVAYAVGFRSPSAFSKAFRKHVGHPPSEHTG